MKRYVAIMFLIASATSCLGQSLFFNGLVGSKWFSVSCLTKAEIERNKEIELRRLYFSADSLKTDATIWIFDERLTVVYRDRENKKDDTIITCIYEADKDKGNLKLTYNGKTVIYKVGINSSGNYVLLIRKRK